MFFCPSENLRPPLGLYEKREKYKLTDGHRIPVGRDSNFLECFKKELQRNKQKVHLSTDFLLFMNMNTLV